MTEPKIAQKTEVLILSGGFDVLRNAYSQFRQTKGLSDFFSGDPDTIVTTLFGGGRRPGGQEPPDVTIKDPEVRFIRGEIAGNISATLENVKTYFTSTLGLRNWMDIDRFILFVTDHGAPNWDDPTTFKIEAGKEGPEVVRDYDQNCISLWTPGIELYPERACLSVSGLSQAIQKHIPENVPVNFVMTQCYSGAFHLLGYTKDEMGFPKKGSREICGFTAVTEDVEASGCTPSIEENKYDGYERRIAELVTGRAVLSGKALTTPVSSLSEAHDQAMLLDHTKDILLRTSDAYLLDYMDATAAQNPKEKENFRSELDQVLKNITPSDKAYAILDLKRRLDLIQKLSEKLEEWHPTYRGEISKRGIAELEAMRKSIKDLIEKSKQLKETDESVSKAFRMMEVRYLHDLKKKTDPESTERLTFETIMSVIKYDAAFERLSKEDPTLKSYARYQNYENNRKKIILEWARQHPKIIKPEDVKVVASHETQKVVSKSEETRLEIVEGELRRLQTQMEAAAMILWLEKNKKKEALADVEALVACEMAATVTGK